MRRLNVKLLVGLICGVVATVISVHVIHGMQIKRNAGVLLTEAEKARHDGDLRDAVKKYSQYIKHRPDDRDSQAEMALLAADIAESPDANSKDFAVAFRTLEAAARHPELTKVRRRHIDFLMRAGRFIDAIDYLNELRAANEQAAKVDPDLDIKYAICQRSTGHEEQAIQVLDRLVGYDEASQQFEPERATAPDSVAAYVLLASIVRARLDDAKRADAVMDQLVAVNPDSPKAHLELGRYSQRNKDLEKATAEIGTALKLAPDDPDVILSAAELAVANKELQQAHELIERGIKDHPSNEGMYRVAAALALSEGKSDEAIETIQAGLKAAPKSQMLLLYLAEVQMQRGDLDGLRDTTKKMRDGNFRAELIGFFETSIVVAQRQWLKAGKQLERLRPQLVSWPNLQLQVDLWLGLCYENLGQPDRQLEAYRRAIDLDPNSLAAQMGHMRALAQTGKQKEAGEKMHKIAEGTSNNSAAAALVRNNLLQLQISEQLQKPVDERDWKDVDATVESMLADGSLSDLQKRVLEFEMMAVKGDLESAQAGLNALLKEAPQEVSIWLADANLLQRRMGAALEKKGKLTAAQQKQFAKASAEKVLQLVDRAEKAAGPHPAFRSLRAQNLVRLGGKDAKDGLAKLEADAAQLSETDRLTLWADLGNAYYRLRDYEDVRRCWKLIAEAKPQEPKYKQALFDLAVEYNDDEAMQQELAEIGKLVGSGSPLYKYCQAARTVWEVKSDRQPKSQLDAARKLAVEASRLRAEWHEPYRLEGEIDELQGNLNSAIANYQKALDLGPANPTTARHLVLLLYRQGRMAEVDKAMAQVGATGGADDPLKKIDIERKLNGKDTAAAGAALELAGQAVAEDSDNPTNHLWYGQLLERANQPDQAEEQFRIAVEKGANMPQAWLMLVQHLVRAKKLAEAESALNEGSEKLPKEQANPVLAQGYELLGNRAEAEKHYLAALAEKPDDPTAERAVAVFYLRFNDPDKARPHIEKLLALKPKADDKTAAAHISWARRAMAQTLARKGDFEDLQRAVKLIEENSPDGKPNSDDVLMLVGILSNRPEASSRQRAVKLLEELGSQRPLNPREQVTLAGLYERAGDWTKARDQMANLVARAGDDWGVLATYIQMLLRHDEVADVASWLSKLERLQPRMPVTLQLRARWLVKQGKPDDAVQYLISAIPNPLKPEDLPILGRVANLLEELNQLPAAEKILRQYYEREPRAILLLANFEGRHGNLDEAFALYDTARKSQELSRVVTGAMQSLRNQPEEATHKHYATVEGWLQAALKDASEDNADTTTLLLQLAELRDLQGRLDEVIEMYRRVLALPKVSDNQRAIVKNNLAFSLATRGSKQDMAEAEKTIDESLAYLGPIADVLDTRGMVLLMKGNVDGAISDIRSAIADAPSAAKYLHLAMAEERAGRKAEAAKAFQEAVEMKLDVSQLPPAEKKAFKHFESESAEK